MRTQKNQACSLGPGQSWLTPIRAEGTEGRGGQSWGLRQAHTLLQLPPSPCSEDYQTIFFLPSSFPFFSFYFKVALHFKNVYLPSFVCILWKDRT